ncbi:DUF6624 domain-containing protein [Runella sp.]|jgi:hypothetical protein|uniref:DUF6624 domain-containing protein n=1 Tax=Runella sp. TaxID=1960881 RepID=UPI00260FF974|nr:DUF6624 domain-containing protein [Runella sp.]
MKCLLLILFCVVSFFVSGQTKEYFVLVKKADSLYKLKDYARSALTYTLAFKANNWKGLSDDRYNAACSWALNNNPDSSFFHLYRIATKADYSDYQHIISDKNLLSLHEDKRWLPLLELIKANKEKEEVNYNKPLIQELDSIFDSDQKYRKMIQGVEKQFGFDSKQMDSLWRIIHAKDSINLIKVTGILDKYGWLGPDIIGWRGGTTLFLVIQHSDLKIQEKYLPVMREAVKAGKMNSGSLALLEDRVALRQGKKQIYGSQIEKNAKGDWVVSPIEEEINVNERRKSVGLEPLEDYVKKWNIDYKLPKK